MMKFQNASHNMHACYTRKRKIPVSDESFHEYVYFTLHYI